MRFTANYDLPLSLLSLAPLAALRIILFLAPSAHCFSQRVGERQRDRRGLQWSAEFNCALVVQSFRQYRYSITLWTARAHVRWEIWSAGTWSCDNLHLDFLLPRTLPRVPALPSAPAPTTQVLPLADLLHDEHLPRSTPDLDGNLLLARRLLHS